MKIFQKFENLPKIWKSSNIWKFCKNLKKFPQIGKFSENLKFFQKSENLLKIWKFFRKSENFLKIWNFVWKSEIFSKIWKVSKNLIFFFENLQGGQVATRVWKIIDVHFVYPCYRLFNTLSTGFIYFSIFRIFGSGTRLSTQLNYHLRGSCTKKNS